MMKKAKILAVILAVLAAGSAAAFFVTKQQAEKEKAEAAAPGVFSLSQSEYTNAVDVVGADGKIYLPTDETGIYYTATLKNEIEFFSYTPDGFAPISFEKKSAKVTLNVSNDKIPVKVTYIDTGSRVIGYGVFTSDMDKSVKAYPYAFVKIAKKPAGYGDGYFLLADFDKSEFYKADKTFSEIYSYKPGNANLSTGVSQNTRLYDINGTYRQDWTMLTDEFINSIGKEKYFMSSRYYTAEETGKRTDIMIYSGNYRPTIAAKDILGTWFVSDEKGMHYLKKTDDGFKCVSKKDSKSKEKEELSFDGDYFGDYLRCGNYIVNKSTGEMTDLMSGDKKTLSGADISKADVFSLNREGTKAVFACKSEPNENGAPVQTIIYITNDGSAEPAVFTEPMLRCEESGFSWITPVSVMSVRPVTDDGSQAGSVVYTFGADAAGQQQ